MPTPVVVVREPSLLPAADLQVGLGQMLALGVGLCDAVQGVG
jgi:hypothetical protein